MLNYQLPARNITSISVDGRAYDVGKDGVVAVPEHLMTDKLRGELTGHFGGRYMPDTEQEAKKAAPEEVERQTLFDKLDKIYGHHIHRGRSLKQLQKMMRDHEARQASNAGKAATPPPEPEPDVEQAA